MEERTVVIQGRTIRRKGSRRPLRRYAYTGSLKLETGLIDIPIACGKQRLRVQKPLSAAPEPEDGRTRAYYGDNFPGRKAPPAATDCEHNEEAISQKPLDD